MAQPYPIVGVEDSGVQPRLEIRDLQQQPIQFSLFIRAMNNIFEMRDSDPNNPGYLNKPNSWWQIGAIHGLPVQQWSGDPNGPQDPDPNSAYGGLCYHASALFPTWHRALMLLVEQAVVNEAINIASKLEEQDPAAKNEKWAQAAKNLRFPFWDWTKPETATEGIPKICQDPEIQIVNPGGSSGSVQNPLNHYRYAAPPGTTQGIEFMGSWERTYRWVNDNNNPTEEQYDQALKVFSEGAVVNLFGDDTPLQPASWLRDKVSALFHYPLTLSDPSYGPNMWGYFSNTAAQSAGIYLPVDGVLGSIEEPHNMVHLDTGGNGTMSVNEYAAFDPIFYLHHCNVDRIYAFWEYLYPNYWIEDGWKTQDGDTTSFVTSGAGNFQQDPDSPINHNYPLVPFRNGASNYWTSDDTRGLLTTGSLNKYYTYPAIKDPRTGVEVKVDTPYDATNDSLREEFQQAILNDLNPELHRTLQTVHNLSANLHPRPRNLLVRKDEQSGTSQLRNFVVSAHVPEFAFPGSYRLELYLPPKNPQEKVHVVNSTSVLGRANAESCAACNDRRAAGSQVHGYMSLDPRVVLYLISQLDHVQLAALTDLDKLSVVIKESLRVRIVGPDGKVLAATEHLGQPSGPQGGVLEPSKAPQLALYSHYINVEHDAYRGVAPVVKLVDHVHHGLFGHQGGWKLF